VTNQAQHCSKEWLCVCETVISRNLASYNHFLVAKFLALLANFRGQYQESLIVLPVLSGQVRLQPCLGAAWPLPEPSIRPFSTSDLSHGSSLPRRPISVASICDASSASAENSPCIGILF